MITLRVNKIKITTKDALQQDNFVTKVNQESNNDKKAGLAISADS